VVKRRFVLGLLLSFIVFFIFVPGEQKVFSQDSVRYATCDRCGYCIGKSVPANWEDCRQCLYPHANTNAQSNDSLKINSATNLPPTPVPGYAYTSLGCVSTDLKSSKNIVQVVLNFIISIVGALSFIYLIYGAFFVITSQGEPERLNEGKRIIMGAAAGLLFSLFAVLIIKIIATQILKTPS